MQGDSTLGRGRHSRPARIVMLWTIAVSACVLGNLIAAHAGSWPFGRGEPRASVILELVLGVAAFYCPVFALVLQERKDGWLGALARVIAIVVFTAALAILGNSCFRLFSFVPVGR